MVDFANATLCGVKTVQAALAVLQTLALTEHHYPPNCALTNGTRYDYIVVGAGTAGSVLAYRLSEDPNTNVLLIEAGGYPPLESELPGLFVMLPNSAYDYKFDSENDNHFGQNLQNSRLCLSQGKMLGGSSAMNYFMHVQGDPHDYNQWGEILSDDGWSYPNLMPYFKKLEHLTDPGLLESSCVELHGTDGMKKIARHTYSTNNKYLDAFKELGHKIVNDTTSMTSTLGYTEPLFTIGDGLRHSSALAYLGPAKERSNLCVALFTTATKIVIENGAAVGLQVTTNSGDTYVLYANKEVLVSAGAINSPKLLMISGIGPREHLESHGIEVVVDLPVGQNLMDHPTAPLVYQMETSTEAAVAKNPHEHPVPTTTGYVALDPSQTYPDYQSINLEFPHDSTGLVQLCSNMFKYSNDICNKFHDASIGRTMMYSVINLLLPHSRGEVLLASADPADDPIVYIGSYSNSTDLTVMGKCLADFNKVLNTTYFKSVNATLVDIGLCSDYQGTEFWECYALATSNTLWHYAGTCAMGLVTDSSMKVKGVDKLRVVDASSMRTEVSGNISAAVAMMAERVAELILSAYNI